MIINLPGSPEDLKAGRKEVRRKSPISVLFPADPS